MLGMDRETGKPLDGGDHLAQSVRDILTTPIGSRVGRRDYGSLVFELVDQPQNPASKVRLYAASALALARWEPRIRVTGFELTTDQAGKVALTVIGQRLDVSQPNARTRLLVGLA